VGVQVVGHCSVQDDQLVEYQRKVMMLSKDFRAVFMERISREDNMRADQLANDAIDEELQVVDSLSEYIDEEWTSHAKHASQQHSVHPHHQSRPHTHPLPLPALHLKVKPVASVSPHVVKHHVDSHKAAARKSDESRRSRLFCSDEEQVGQVGSPVRNHVQAATKSRRSHRLLSSSPTRRPDISASFLPHWDTSQFDSSFLDEFTGNSGDANLQQGEGNPASGSGTVNTTEQAEDSSAISSSSEESV